PMTDAPYMPFFIDAYLADTTHLKVEQHGAYLLLLFAMWRRGGSIPDDDRDNARMVGVSVHRWRAMKPRLMPFLTVLPNGELTQKRLKKEFDFVRKASESQREKAFKRW